MFSSILPDFDLAGGVVGLRGAIAQRNVQRKAGRIVRIIAAEDLAQQVAVPAGQVRDAALRQPERRDLAGQAVVRQFGEGVQRGLQRTLDPDQIGLLAFDVDAGRFDFHAVAHRFRHQFIHGPNLILSSGSRSDRAARCARRQVRKWPRRRGSAHSSEWFPAAAGWSARSADPASPRRAATARA